MGLSTQCNSGQPLAISVRGETVFIDAEDLPKIEGRTWRIFVSKSGGKYALATTSRSTIWMHREILGLTPFSGVVDHKDGNGLNNCKSNLRIATPGQNASNRKLRCGGAFKAKNKWMARISSRLGNKYLGLFDTKEEAQAAYQKAAKELYGEFFRG